MMPRLLPLSIISLVLFSACSVDTTGLSEKSSRGPAGNPSAGVVVTEFGDLQCPACQSAYELINKPLMQQYSTRVRFDFKHFPLRNIHEYAFEAAQASECAADQGKFWEFVDMDYTNQKKLNSDALRAWAAALKLDTALFGRCLDSGIKAKTVSDDLDEGTKIGVDSTPTYFVNGQKVPNTIEAIGGAIEAALKQQQNAPL